MKPVAEQTILVTGATDGLGKGVALALGRLGATVLVHGRSPERIGATVALVKGAGARDARAYRADFSRLDDVRALASSVLSNEPRLDAIVNNAGIGTTVPGGSARQESADGVELRFAVNYLAGYLLTRELLPLLRRSAPARVVNVSSAGQAPIDFADPMLHHGYGGTRAYCQSKLAQILWTFDLAAELEGSGVTATALHPATFMPTKIVPNPVSTLEEGVEATLRLVVAPELEGVTGRYFDGVREARPDAQAFDAEARRSLRALSERLVGGERRG